MLEITFHIFIFLILFLYQNNNKKLLMCVVLINILTDSIILYSEEFLLNPGLVRLLSCFIIIFSQFSWLKKNKFFYYITALIIFYSLIAFTNSSDRLYSITNVFKFLIPFIFYPLTIEFLKRHRKNNLYFKNSILISILYLTIILIIAQIYKLGESPYIDGFFYLGGMNVQISYTLAYSVIFLLFVYSSIPQKIFSKITFFLAVFFSILIIILIFRRVAIVSVFLSLFFYLLSLYKVNLLKISLVSGLIILALNYTLYNKDDMLDMVEQRQTNKLADEGRYLEFNLIANDMQRNGFFSIFLGNELFNSRYHFSKFGVEKMQNQEQLHTDVATILHGAGISGLFFYLILFFSIIKNAFKGASSKQIFFPIIPLILSFVLFSFSGQYYIFTSLTFFCIILAFLKSYYSNYKV